MKPILDIPMAYYPRFIVKPSSGNVVPYFCDLRGFFFQTKDANNVDCLVISPVSFTICISLLGMPNLIVYP